MQLSRRNLIEGAAISAGLSFSAERAQASVRLETGAVILFQGDSITDVNRDRTREGEGNDPRAMGLGYPFLLASALLRDHADRNLTIYNRGISGNKVPDLEARWQPDCLALKPSLLSILIGVNDIWHKLNGNYSGTIEQYESGFRALLARTTEELPHTTLVVCEPFVLRCGAVNEEWFPEFDERRAAARRVAASAGALWVPFQKMFDDAVKTGTAPEYWARDGVHPSMAGHALMAKTWRAVVGI